jgi:hypothetical protein
MKRLRLFELGDQGWVPQTLRRALVEFLAFGGNLSEAPYRELAGKLGAALRATGADELHDARSSGPGPCRA